MTHLLATVGTFVLGCTGADANGEISQVRDDAGGMLFDPRHGTLMVDRAKWPQGVRPAPQFGVTDTHHHIFAVTNTASATFMRPAS